jgi:YjbE family integral membrane protein
MLAFGGKADTGRACHLRSLLTHIGFKLHPPAQVALSSSYAFLRKARGQSTFITHQAGPLWQSRDCNVGLIKSTRPAVHDLFSHAGLAALAQVILIDLVLAGDNAVVIGIAAAGLARQQRRRAILVGILAATAMRIAFAFVAVELLAIIGLVLAGGILLLWVSWKMWRELRASAQAKEDQAFDEGSRQPHAPKTFAQAAWQIVFADVSMSLDNVLAVAGAAREACPSC